MWICVCEEEGGVCQETERHQRILHADLICDSWCIPLCNHYLTKQEHQIAYEYCCISEWAVKRFGKNIAPSIKRHDNIWWITQIKYTKSFKTNGTKSGTRLDSIIGSILLQLQQCFFDIIIIRRCISNHQLLTDTFIMLLHHYIVHKHINQFLFCYKSIDISAASFQFFQHS